MLVLVLDRVKGGGCNFPIVEKDTSRAQYCSVHDSSKGWPSIVEVYDRNRFLHQLSQVKYDPRIVKARCNRRYQLFLYWIDISQKWKQWFDDVDSFFRGWEQPVVIKFPWCAEPSYILFWLRSAPEKQSGAIHRQGFVIDAPTAWNKTRNKSLSSCPHSSRVKVCRSWLELCVVSEGGISRYTSIGFAEISARKCLSTIYMMKVSSILKV